jgi:hypothetical protein
MASTGPDCPAARLAHYAGRGSLRLPKSLAAADQEIDNVIAITSSMSWAIMTAGHEAAIFRFTSIPIARPRQSPSPVRSKTELEIWQAASIAPRATCHRQRRLSSAGLPL